MDIGSKVRWTLETQETGTGVICGPIVTWPDGTQRALVAVDPNPYATSQFGREAHVVIHCTLTWLTEIK